MRLLVPLGLVGVWEAASALGGPLLVTAACTAAAVLLATWAIAVLREG